MQPRPSDLRSGTILRHADAERRRSDRDLERGGELHRFTIDTGANDAVVRADPDEPAGPAAISRGPDRLSRDGLCDQVAELRGVVVRHDVLAEPAGVPARTRSGRRGIVRSRVRIVRDLD